MTVAYTPRPAHVQWSSRLGFILAATGAAVGLGNIWKFPYMAGSNGGSAFVLVYLLCVLAIGLPVMLAEMLIGRRARQNPVSALGLLAMEAKRSRYWQGLGWLGAGTLLLVLSFYSVVAGWALAYLAKAWGGAFKGLSATEVTAVWSDFLSHPLPMLAWHALFMVMTLWVVMRGVQKGLETASKIMMPLLFFMLILLDGYATSTGSFMQGFHFLFDVNFHKITSTVVVDAMGHAFFTLAVGAGAMLTYGSYLSKNVQLGNATLVIAGLDVLVAFLAGMAIFPIVFAHHLTPTGGPGLMFQVLPIAFAQMGGGQFLGGLFFLLLLFAAWTSSISMAEPLVALLTERYGFARRNAGYWVGSVAWVLGIVSALSFNVWSGVKLFGQWDLFTVITDLATNILLPIGGFLFAIFAGWVMEKHISQEELSFSKHGVYIAWLFLTRFVAPIGILIILISSVIG